MPARGAVGEVAPGERRFHVRRYRVPRRRPDRAVDAAVGDDLDVAVGEQQVDQDAGVLLGVPDPQQPEDFERALARREPAQHVRADAASLDGEAAPGRDASARRRRSPARCASSADLGKRAAHRQVIGDEMAPEALRVRDGHRRYQLPDEPPPPKPPPPPEKPPPPPKPPPPKPPPPQPPVGIHMPPRRPMPPPAPNSSMTRNATTPAPIAIASDPARNHAPSADHAATDVDPSVRPKMRDRMPPITGTTTNSRISSVWKSKPPDGGAGARFAAQRGARADDRDDPVDAGIDPLGELALLEQRRHGLGDDPMRGHVGQHAFEAVADLDAHLPVVLGDQEDRAVVLALVPDLPRVGDADRIRFDRSPAAVDGTISTTS